ncbi:WD-REPEATS-REGION domain-containing protein [Mycena indigotica]|uniref:WD-REPEATS-REGION domain-containing protein n=1 Tax=Mycena indigotica TaxID=2126181 RepID=A0A8H6TGA9_9AGAR|nr:WD-REPEATS-REGION domain-containing protein [Mycena indigotica]KAF7316197.1 WD-REPEATS-REGION domain-containing protein [Mycena indigotica]
MAFRVFFALFLCLVLALRSNACENGRIHPKVFIITMFDLEAQVWFNIPEFTLDRKLVFPGLPPKYPSVNCTNDGNICLVTTGQAEVNAASTISAVVYSGNFNLTSTYFLVAGVAGINPKLATIGAVTFARYAVQVGVQFEVDARQIPSNFSTGYFAQGSTGPGQPPSVDWWYGTEVFELNDALRQAAFNLTMPAILNDSVTAQAARAPYSTASVFAPGATDPKIVLCDTATSDTYWSGDLLGEMVENTTKVLTNGNAVYCTTQQEDNATLNVLFRATLAGLLDFSRVIVMRAGSDFDRPYATQTVIDNLLGPTPGFAPSLMNLYLVGIKVVEGIISQWDGRFAAGVKPMNYIGDVFGSLVGDIQPDFGPTACSNQ